MRWYPRSVLLLLVLPLVGCGSVDVDPAPAIGPADVDHPIGWYPLDDPDAIGRDRSGSGHDGVPLALDVVSDAERGHATRFDVGSLVVAPPSLHTFTIALWIKTSTQGPDQTGWVNGPRIIDADVSGLRLDFGLGLALDKLALGIGAPGDQRTDNTALKSQRAVVDGHWHHAAFTRDGDAGAWQLFVDGALEGTKTGGAGDLALTKTIAVGGTGNTTPMSPPLIADLSDLRFYDRVLSAAAIAFLATR